MKAPFGSFFLMKQFDYIIVGQGLAGTVLSFRLQQLGKTVLVIDKHRELTSSKIAPGAYNPMVLKRFTPCWMVEKQLDPLYTFIREFEEKFELTIHEPIKLHRLFKSVQEQNLWMEKSEKKSLAAFMNPSFIPNTNQFIDATFGYGEVNHSGRVRLGAMIAAFRTHLLFENALIDEDFDFSSLSYTNDSVTYKSFTASKIIFCEGHRLSLNPLFNYLPLMRTKGELLTVRIKGLNLKEHLKSSVSILPLGDDLYKVGATFNWDEKDELCTENAKSDLLARLSSIVNMPVELINHEAGLRPTVKDRRALIGQHPVHKSLFVFNGLGARGLLISPLLSLEFASYLEQGTSLNTEVNINRYQDLYPC